MICVLDARAARRVAAVATIAAPEADGRPVLASVQVEWTPEGSRKVPSATFVATDSYKLIAYEVDEMAAARRGPTPLAFGRVGEPGNGGETLIPAEPLRKALEKAASHATVNDPEGMVVLTAEADSPLMVYARHSEKGEVEVAKIEQREGKFPKWRQLTPERVRRRQGIGDNYRTALATVVSDVLSGTDESELDRIIEAIDQGVESKLRSYKLTVIADDELEQAALNPEYLGKLLDAYRAGRHPITENAALKVSLNGMKPATLYPTAQADGWMALLMPVRL